MGRIGDIEVSTQVLGTVTIGDCMDRMAEIILRWWQRRKELVF